MAIDRCVIDRRVINRRVINREFIPGPGIYRNNSGTGKYRFLIPADYAVDCYTGDAWQCDSSGNVRPGYETAEPFHASDFGERVGEINYE